MKTSKDYTLTFKHYGEITVPAGTSLTNKTAMGIDPKYHFVDDMRWIYTNYADIANILKDDVAYSGINVPLEYVEQEIVPPVSANEVAQGNISLLKYCPSCNNYVEFKSDHIGDVSASEVLVTCYFKYCPSCLEVIESTVTISK